MIAAFVDRDPDDPTPPLRRVGTATFVSVLLGIVLLAGVAPLGMLGGGVANKSWREAANTVLSDTQSGALFVWNGEALVPMADIASALLKAAPQEGEVGGPASVLRVKTDALRGERQRGGAGHRRRTAPAPRSQEDGGVPHPVLLHGTRAGRPLPHPPVRGHGADAA